MSKKTGMLLSVLGGAAVLAVLALMVVNYLLRDTAPSSGTLGATPLALNTAAPTPTPPPGVENTIAPVAQPTTPPIAESPTAPSAGLTLFQIEASQSQASFSIYEELGGQPKTVIGTTNEVAGQLAVNVTDLSQTQVGVIQVGVRSLVTDSNRRDNAIRRFILNTDQYEFVTFTPTSLSGLSGAAQVGQAFTFQLTGELTIRNVTQTVTFDVTAQGVSDTQISGTATAVILRSDYGLEIPSVPNVANVGDEVTLQLNFVANAQGQ